MQYAHAIVNSDLEDLSKFIPVELNRKQISFCSSILDIQECGEINGAFTQYYRHACGVHACVEKMVYYNTRRTS